MVDEALGRNRNCGCTNGSPVGRRAVCRWLSCVLRLAGHVAPHACALCVCVCVVKPCGALWWFPCFRPFPALPWFGLDRAASESVGNVSVRKSEPELWFELDRSVPGSVCNATERKTSRAQRLESVVKTLSERCRRPLCKRLCLVTVARTLAKAGEPGKEPTKPCSA